MYAWCACIVRWCGNECGYIENGIMPYSIGCVPRMNGCKKCRQWIDGNEEPLSGLIILTTGMIQMANLVYKMENRIIQAS